jgi:hypothetical protein
MNQGEKINLDELYKQKKLTSDLKIQNYNKILNRVHKKIKSVARLRNSDEFCFFVLPEFVLGIPRYDMTACTSYIIEKLKTNGFKVKYTHPNLLFISWKHYIPSYKRAEYKKKTGVKIDGFGNVLTSKKNNKDGAFTNNLLLNKKPNMPVGQKKATSNKKEYNNVSNYKPKGNLIYGSDLIKRIQNVSLDAGENKK